MNDDNPRTDNTWDKINRATVTDDELEWLGALSKRDEEMAKHRPPNIAGQTGRSYSLSVGANGPAVRKNTVVSATASMPSKDTVELPGVGETNRKAAIDMGWWDADKNEPTPAWMQTAQGAVKSGASEAKAQPEATTGDDVSEPTQAMREADTLMQDADKVYGADTVNAVVAQVAETGDLEKALPAEFPRAAAEHIVKGYISYADEVLKPTGVTAEMMSAVLSDRDLTGARKATVSRNLTALRAYAKETIKALATMPVRDPEGFKWLKDTYFPGVRVKKGQNGQTLIQLASGDYTSWEGAVHMGAIRF